MFGFETVFGIAAGGAGLLSLSIQLGESVMKLKRLYNAAKNAPQTVSTLAFDLETMAMALQEMECRRQQTFFNDTILTRCLTTCRQGVSKIQDLVDKMESQLTNHSRVRGRVYTAFKERDIQDLYHELERAKTSLELAYMMYLAEEQRQRDLKHSNALYQLGKLLENMQAQVQEGNADISQQLTLVTEVWTPKIAGQQTPSTNEQRASHGDELSSGSCDSLCLSDISVIHQHRSKSARKGYRAKFNLPTWLCRRVWDFTIDHLQCGWSIHLQTYNTVSFKSSVIVACRSGDLNRLRTLIATGEASPLDRVHGDGYYRDGTTLLEVSTLKDFHFGI